MSFPNMNTSLKINKRTRKSTFDKLNLDENTSNDKLHFSIKVNEKDLEKIKTKLQKENKSKTIKTAILFILFSTIFLLAFLYL